MILKLISQRNILSLKNKWLELILWDNIAPIDKCSVFFGIALSIWPIYIFKSLLRNCPYDPSIGISEAILILWTELEIFAICWIWWVMVWGSSYVLYEIYLMHIQTLNVLICNILLFIDIADNSLKTLVWNWENSQFSNALEYFGLETMNSS